MVLQSILYLEHYNDFVYFQFLVEENETIQKEKLQEEYNDRYPLFMCWWLVESQQYATSLLNLVPVAVLLSPVFCFLVFRAE